MAAPVLYSCLVVSKFCLALAICYTRCAPSQESHVSPVRGLCFNQADPTCSNLVATVGGGQAHPRSPGLTPPPKLCSSAAELIYVLLRSLGHFCEAYVAAPSAAPRSAAFDTAVVPPGTDDAARSEDSGRSVPPTASGDPQATVYDDMHMGGNVCIVVHFVNSPTEHSAGGVSAATSTWTGAGQAGAALFYPVSTGP